MKLTNIAGEVIADDMQADNQIIRTTVSVKQSSKMPQEARDDLLEYAKRLFDD
ncbi:hypothetical protein [Weissella muntiaci]|uniref:hypothetical protein n=1 Tax=Weissella muntiaci TaxID=2508881 RepID=UPI001651F90A|nr:hypothetical protein [Weissella muntiaci]